MFEFQDWEEAAKALVSLTDENAALKKDNQELMLSSEEDAAIIRNLRSQVAMLEGQIEAFKYCISHGGRR